MREKQIEEMAELICDNTGFDTMREDCVEAAEALYNAGYRKRSEWISVEERLPDENGRYLAHIKVEHLAFENLSIVAILQYGKSQGFDTHSEETVTHWMPLPEPPKMKGGE